MKKDYREVLRDLADAIDKAANGKLTPREAELAQESCDQLVERFDMCLLMAGAVGDIALPTNLFITDWEQGYEYPMEGDKIDTETVYYDVEKDAEKIREQII